MTLRRDFLSMTAGAVAARTVLPIAAKTGASTPPIDMLHPDADLLRSCAAFDALELEVEATFHRGCPSFIEDEEARDDANELRWDAQSAILSTIGDTPAHTYDGLVAKIRSFVTSHKEILKSGTGEIGHVLLASACRDALRLPADPTIRVEDLDAEVIAICARHRINQAALDSAPADMAVDDPLWAAYGHTRDAISTAKPRTLDGMVAKARVAEAEARIPSGDDRPNGLVSGMWAWDLVQDLLRVGRS